MANGMRNAMRLVKVNCQGMLPFPKAGWECSDLMHLAWCFASGVCVATAAVELDNLITHLLTKFYKSGLNAL